MTRRVYVAGHRGLVGSAMDRLLGSRDGVDLVHRELPEVDLRDAARTTELVRAAQPDVVVLAAARVGSLGANLADPVGFLEDNLRIQMNVIRAAFEAGVQRLLFVASANAYPAAAAQPIREAALGTGALDSGTEAYGLAKLTGVRLCDAFRRQHGVVYHSVVPSNVYGPHDRFDPGTAHLVAAMLQRFAAAVDAGDDTVVVWGSGRQRRQLLYVDDLARACEVLLDLDDPPTHVNVAPDGDVAVGEVAEHAAATVGFTGRIVFDRSRPEGVARRELDPSLARCLGWAATVGLAEGMQRTWDWYATTSGATRR